MATKYPKTIIDETSGIEVPSELYKAYQDGIREVVEWLILHQVLQDQYNIKQDEWQSKLKGWSINNE